MQSIIRRPIIQQPDMRSGVEIPQKNSEQQAIDKQFQQQQQLITQQQTQLEQAQLTLKQEQAQFRQQKEQFLQSCEELKRQAVKQGLEQGKQLAGDELAAQRANVQQILGQCHEQYSQCLILLEKQLLPILYAALSRFFIQWSPDKESLTALCQQAISQVMDETIIHIRLNPVDYRLLQTNDELMTFSHSVKLIADSKIKGGGCVVETELGQLDAQLTTQFEQLKTALLARYS